MRSTYDRRGGNEGADASHFLYQQADDFNVALDVAGPGVLYFVRCNHWHGSPWHYEIDGRDHLVRESSTADPDHPLENSTFIPADIFPAPLAWTWSTTKGADLNWTPVSFQKSLRLAYSRTRYGTGYYIYHCYDRSAPLSRPIRSWDGKSPPDRDVLDLLSRAGTDIAPCPDTPEGKRLEVIQMGGGPMRLGKDITLQVQQIPAKQPALLRALEFSIPRDQAVAFGRARLRITWDGLPAPSIDAPVALFFGAGTLYNRDDREYLVKSFPLAIRFEKPARPPQGPAAARSDHGDGQTADFSPGRVHLACYFPMPFFRSMRIELVGDRETDLDNIRWSVRYHPLKDRTNHVAHFHATYQDHPAPEPGHDLLLLDTRSVEGGGDWSGNFVGTSWIFSRRAVLNTLEGDPRFFFDDSQTPQAYGTGTEEWGGGGDYWGGRNMTLPFAGHPVGARNEKEALNDEDRIESAYRFLLADLMPFGNRAVIRLEHGGENQSTEHYETVAYWYGANRPTLVRTDQLKVGDNASEEAHRYVSADASPPYEFTSRYEWGVDTLNGKEIFPAESDKGRKTTSQSTFTIRLTPDNYGVVLRRKLDYSFPNQRAEVYVADDSAPSPLPGKSASAVGALEPGPMAEAPAERARRAGGREPAWKPAGIWYLAGGNTCVYSNPKEELGATQHIVQTSNRRFRDDEFIIPRDLTRGRSAIRVRLKFTPVRIPLFPGHPIAELAWSEMRYDAYCWVMPSTARQ